MMEKHDCKKCHEEGMNKSLDEWKLKIKKVTNGYILKGKFGDSDIITELVIEENNTSDTSLEAMSHVLYEVKEYFGIYYSKHNKQNLEINIVENKNDS